MTKKSADGKEWQLVVSGTRSICDSERWLTLKQFSDEFETPGRSFYDGDDPYYQAMDFWYGVTQDLEASTDFVFQLCTGLTD